MHTTFNKILSLSIIILTALGILLSLFLIIQTWRLREPVTLRLESISSQTNTLLGTTEQGLVIIDEIITNVYSSTTSLESSTTSLAQTSQDSSQFVGSIGSFLGVGLVNTITNTQIAINSAQSSAVVIDNILTAMSRIPLIGIDYNPSRPLNIALGEVAASLDPLQANLMGFETNLKSTQTSMQEFSGQVLDLRQNILTINKNLKASMVLIDNYQSQIKSLRSWLENVDRSLPGWIKTISWVITFFIFWLILVQLAILLQAADVLKNKKVYLAEVDRSEITPP